MEQIKTQDAIETTPEMGLKYDKLAAALCKAQAEIGGAIKDKKNPFFKSDYADLESVCRAVRGPFASNGLSYTQLVDILPNGQQMLITRLMHTSGQSLESRMLLMDTLDAQKFGGDMTYKRRYSLMAMAGIPAVDDDGNLATGKCLSAEDLALLKNAIGDDRELIAHILSHYQTNSFATILASQKHTILNMIKARKSNAGN